MCAHFVPSKQSFPFLFLHSLDAVVTPELFAQVTCEDLDLPLSFRHAFASQVRAQLSDYALQKADFPTISPSSSSSSSSSSSAKQQAKKGSKEAKKLEEEADRKTGILDDTDDEWWAGWRKKVRMNEEGGFVGVGAESKEGVVAENEKPASSSSLLVPNGMNGVARRGRHRSRFRRRIGRQGRSAFGRW